jgi:phosphoribosyl 1,2-cyclic phosphodiesterase
VRVTVLASGSAGNAVLVEGGKTGKTKLLVDCGLPARELAKRLDRSATGARLEDLRGVLCTHEHGDHAGGVPALASAGLPTYATAGTARALGLAGTRGVAAGGNDVIDDVMVLTVAMPHDAVEPVGFIVDDGEGRVGVITDCGHADPAVAAAFADCDILILEANHDPDLLRAGAYPPSLKRRIASSLGHLSNFEAAELLRLMGPPRAQVIVLAHLSAENNQPRLARTLIDQTLIALGVRPRILVAAQERPAPPIVSERGRVRILPGMDDRQLRLAFPDPP